MTVEPICLSDHGLAVLGAALFLDLAIGDPLWLPHPVRLMGWIIAKGEGVARRIPAPERLQGALLSIVVVGLSAVGALGTASAASVLSPAAGAAVSVVMVFYGLSLRCLADEVSRVGRSLREGDILEARRRLSRIVGRDTAAMDQGQIAMAAIETAAENLVDGFTSPFFYACIAGPTGIMAYKAVNTLDSMIGYQDSRYRRFGTFAARLDDAANFLPARLTLAFLALAAPFVRGEAPWTFWTTAVREARKHSSPNSGLSEAAFAMVLGVRLGGPAVYGGRRVERGFIMEHNPLPSAQHVSRAVRLLYASGLGCAVSFCLLPNFLF